MFLSEDLNPRKKETQNNLLIRQRQFLNQNLSQAPDLRI